MAAPTDTETPSLGRQMSVHVSHGGALHPSLCGTAPAWAAGAHHNLQHLEARSPTSSSTKKASHSETVEFPQHFLLFCLLDASSLCSRRLFLIPEPTAISWKPAASRLLMGRRQPWQRPEEGRHHLHRLSGEGIFPRKAAGVCPSPSDIPSKRLL